MLILSEASLQISLQSYLLQVPSLYLTQYLYSLRNKCAHGAVLFDLRLPKGICGKGPKLGLKGNDYQNLYGALSVLHFILNHISENRTSDFQNELNSLCKRISYENSNVTEILKSCSGLKF